MSDLGRFLEVVFGPREAFAAVQGVIRTRTDRELASRATGGGRTAIGKRRTASTRAEGESNVETATIDFWIEPPDRFRLERRTEQGESRRDGTKIVDGKLWWKIEAGGRVEMNAPDASSERPDPGPGLSHVECHFVAASLREYFVSLVLEAEGAIRTAGTDCLKIRATPRPDARIWPHWLPYGSDFYEFHADVERGTLLYVAGFFEGKAFDTSEVESVVYDEPIDPARFVYAPKADDRVRSARPISEQVTLEEAVARVPFVVLLPRERGEFDFAQFMLGRAPDAADDAPPTLTMFPSVGRSRRQLWMHQAGENRHRDFAGCAFEEFERDGQRFSLSDPGEGMRILTFVRHGTHVGIVSDLEADRLIELALSLVPANELPRS